MTQMCNEKELSKLLLVSTWFYNDIMYRVIDLSLASYCKQNGDIEQLPQENKAFNEAVNRTGLYIKAYQYR